MTPTEYEQHCDRAEANDHACYFASFDGVRHFCFEHPRKLTSQEAEWIRESARTIDKLIDAYIVHPEPDYTI